MKSWIMHIDMDTFFVSVERVCNPGLEGKPIIVGGDPAGRGVVACASYEVRKYGVKAGMPLSTAKKLCPSAIFLKGSWEKYSMYSEKVMSILNNYTPDIEQVSIDEAYLDLTGTERLWGHPYELAENIQRRIKKETGLDATIGLGSNKLIAKIASGLAKPRGVLWIMPNYEAAFLSYLPLEKIPGVGPKTAQIFKELNIRTAKELLSIPSEWIRRTFGDSGLSIYKRAMGIDDSKVISFSQLPKSVSREITFDEDTENLSYLIAILQYLMEELCTRIRAMKAMCKTISLKLRYSDFQTIERSAQLNNFSCLSYEIFPVAKELLIKNYNRRVKIRLIGITFSNLIYNYRQGFLFEEKERRKWSLLAPYIDKIRSKYGFSSILPATFLRNSE